MPRQARLDSPGTLHHVIIRGIEKKEGVNKEELQGGSRRGRISQIRAQLAIELTEGYGLTLAEAGRQLGVSTSAISRIFIRNSEKIS
jgi:DNA-directed RNA polymerase specialized sigma subunit